MAEWKEREIDRYKHDKWYQNIWFHHKGPIIAIVLAVVILGVLLYSSHMTDPTDIYILHITESPEVYKEKTISLNETITKYAEDKNGDGKITVYIENLYIGEEFDATNVFKNKEKIMTVIRSGDCMFMIADEVGAQYLHSAEACQDLSGVLTGEAAENLEFENKLWNWKDSEFKNTNETLSNIFGDSSLYFGLRIFEGTIAEYTDHAQKNFEVARNLLISITENTQNTEKAE